MNHARPVSGPVIFVVDGSVPDAADLPSQLAGHAERAGVRYEIRAVCEYPKIAPGHFRFWVVHPEGDAFGLVAADKIPEAVDKLEVLRREYRRA